MNEKEIYARAYAVFGLKSQFIIAVEEMVELSISLLKFLSKDASITDVGDEIADVAIVIDQFISEYPEVYEIFEKRRKYKMERLETRIASGKPNRQPENVMDDVIENLLSKLSDAKVEAKRARD